MLLIERENASDLPRIDESLAVLKNFYDHSLDVGAELGCPFAVKRIIL